MIIENKVSASVGYTRERRSPGFQQQVLARTLKLSTSLAHTFVDLWNMTDWMAKDFITCHTILRPDFRRRTSYKMDG